MAVVHGTKMRLVDWLDDLSVRFLINLPASELSAVPRMCFQVEEAQWYYEDFIRPAAAAAGDPLPSLSLRQFCLLLFQHCPLLSGFTDAQHVAAYEEFLAYKVRVPVRGAILMNQSMEKLVLVKGWKKSASWSFPRGKINKDEKDLDCAIREVYEECGYDIRQAGLIPKDESEVKYINITMREPHMQLFVFRGVPEDTFFEPKTRKEISKIAWYNVRDLPGFRKQKGDAAEGAAGLASKFYMVAPFLAPLKKWISREKEKDVAKAKSQMTLLPSNENEVAETITEDEADAEELNEDTPELAVPVLDMEEEHRPFMDLDGSAPSPMAHLAHASVARPIDNQSNGLLALLRGASKPDMAWHKPESQLVPIERAPHRTETWHQTQPVTLNVVHQQPLAIPQRMQYDQQQQQRHAYLPAHPAFGHNQNAVAQQHHQSLSAISPMRADHQHFQQRHSVPANAHQYPSLAFQDPRSFNGSWQNQPQAPHKHHHVHLPWQQAPHLQSHMQPLLDQRSSVAFDPQRIQLQPGSGPQVPSASNLPMPKVSAHTAILLDAFKSSATPAAAGLKAPHTARHPSQHQTALLDLFSKSSTAQNRASPPTAGFAIPTDATERPPKLRERRLTLNEITRTLPKIARTKSPVETETPAIPSAPLQLGPQAHQALVQPLPLVQTSLPSMQESQRPVQALHSTVKATRDRPKSRQLYDPKDAKTSKRSSTESPRLEAGPVPAPMSILQRPPGSGAAVATKQQVPSVSIKHALSSSPTRIVKGTENGHPTPAFTILARPGSARGSSSSPQIPSSPLRKETPAPAFQPQVLRREQANGLDSHPHDPSGEQRPANDATGKRDQLLALFGKSAPATLSPTQSALREITQTPAATDMDKPRNGLLDLFTPAPTAPVADTSTPPPPVAAPPIAPESEATRPNALLDLFDRPTLRTQNSPGTPISPFTLGTPVQKHPARLSELDRSSRLGSVASATGSGATSPALASPAETKEFLLGFLQGVVQKQRGRGG